MTTGRLVSIVVAIHDETKLVEAARIRWLTENPREPEHRARALFPDGHIDMALGYLLDAGPAPDGCEFLENSCENIEIVEDSPGIYEGATP